MAQIWYCHGWHRPEAAVLIRPLIWELPYAAGEALKKIFLNPILQQRAGKKSQDAVVCAKI